MTKERYIYLDIAKIIGIWLVILGHYTASMNVSFENNIIWHVMFDVTLFHMPLFFIISGLLYKPTDFKKTVQKGWTQLLIPYLIMGIVGLTLEYVMSQFNTKVLIKALLGLFSGNDLGGYGTLSYTRPIWFLYSLFLVKILMSLSLRARLWGGGFFLLGFLFLFVGNRCWFRIDSSLIGFMFFYIGFLFREPFLKLSSLSTVRKISIIVLCLIILFLIAQMNIDYGKATGGMSINMCRAGKYPLLFVISGVVGTIMTISLSSLITNYFKNITSITLLSNGTIVILGFHMMVYIFFIKTMFGISNNLITVIGMSIVTLLLCIIIVVLSSKYFPILLGNRK